MGNKATTPAASELTSPQPQHPSVSFMLTRAANQNPNGIATIDHFTGRKRTWAQVLDRVSRLATVLTEKLGLKPGGRVGLVALNSDRYFELFFAASFAGGIIVPINIRLAPPEMVEQFNDCTSSIIFVDENFWDAVVPEIEHKCPKVHHIIFAGDKRPAKATTRNGDYEELIASHEPIRELKHRGGSDTFGIFYTGGTTGKSKGVELTHSNIFINALGHVGLLNYSPQSVYLHSAPMFHLADGASTFGVTMAAGTHVFLPKFVPTDVLDCIEKHQVNRAMMVPAMIAMMLATPPTTRNLTSLENVMYGASPMPKALLTPALKMFPNARFRQGYGMTETSPAITSLAPEFHDNDSVKMTSVGTPVPWVEVKIVDSTGKEVPRLVVGEIATRGPHVMKGYYNMPEKTKESFTSDGFLLTQDGGYMDEDGFVFIVDRLKDMIITGGENVYSAEVENCVMAYPGVAQCAVVGFPDPTFVEIVTAVLVLNVEESAFDQKEFIAHCRSRIANYKVPRKVVILKELPMSGAGKILKNKVRELLGTDRMGKSKI